VTTVEATDYGLPPEYVHVYSGKVRDLYRTPEGRLLFVASDRISAFDHVLPSLIPDKGRILTALSLWWFRQLEDIVPNHITPGRVPDQVAGRAMVCAELEMLPVECVVRGYITGSGLVEYQEKRSISGVNLPPGLKDGSLLPKVIFTPATKAAVGEHDENINFDEVMIMIGQEEAQELKRLSLLVYERAAEISAECGLILADTKFEFGISKQGRFAGQIMLADEVLTPDSSRFWNIETWAPGGPQPSYDKQFVRDWLTSPESGWDKNSGQAPPPLPQDIIDKTRTKYIEAYELLTGKTFK
jgi:phosphoribosylaminoimidazole-succinocarboxamide synthase